MTPSIKSGDAINRSKPKRPLSAYNLYYRFKRAKIIEAQNGIGSNMELNKEAVFRLVSMTPGLENYPMAMAMSMPRSKVDSIRRSNVRTILSEQLLAKDRKKRVHRKSSHGFKMSFVEMNKLMVESWKVTDNFTKAVFQELAEDGRKEYQLKLVEYNRTKHLAFCDGQVGSIPGQSAEAKKADQDVASREEVSSAPTKAEKPPISRVESSASSSSELDQSWEPLPFRNDDDVSLAASSDKRSTTPDVVQKSTLGTMGYPLNVVPSYTSQICVDPSVPAFVTPVNTTPKPSVRSIISFDANSITSSESALHGACPSSPIMSSSLPLPLTCPDLKRSASSSVSDINSDLGVFDQNLSVEDFMELLDEI